MAINEETMRAIALEVSAYVTTHQALQKVERKLRPRLILPESVRRPSDLSESARAAKLRRIDFLRARYDLQWLIDQATAGQELEDLDDEALVALARDFERALECIQEGVSFLDAGLLKAFVD